MDSDGQVLDGEGRKAELNSVEREEVGLVEVFVFEVEGKRKEEVSDSRGGGGRMGDLFVWESRRERLVRGRVDAESSMSIHHSLSTIRKEQRSSHPESKSIHTLLRPRGRGS